MGARKKLSFLRKVETHRAGGKIKGTRQTCVDVVEKKGPEKNNPSSTVGFPRI